MNGLNISLEELKISSDAELYHSRIERLLFTSRNERMGSLEFGSLIPDLFYEPADADLIADIIRETEYLITTYEKDLFLNSIECSINTENDLVGMILIIEAVNKMEEKEVVLEFIKVRSI